VTGSIKFDIELPAGLAERGQAFRAQTFGDRPVWVAASTHDREEQKVLDAHRRVQEKHPDALLVLVPRHPERFAEVGELVTKLGFSCVSRTGGQACNAETEVFLGNTMGELPLFYAASDVAFVGGSLVKIGGHNLLEPAALGLPIVSGPHVFNAQEIADMFADLGACRIVDNPGELANAISELLGNKALAAELGSQGRELLQQNRGALARLLGLLEPLLGEEVR
jgi:3-deoxy-D-manno-octulosonic-acid transferase